MQGKKPAAARSGCPLNAALEALGDRWSLLIVRDMAINGATTYQQFLAAGEGIATNVLAARLRQLEASGIVERSPDPADDRRRIYTLTPKGLDLVPAILELILWGAKHYQTSAPPATLREIERDRGAFVENLRRSAPRAPPPRAAGPRRPRRVRHGIR